MGVWIGPILLKTNKLPYRLIRIVNIKPKMYIIQLQVSNDTSAQCCQMLSIESS